MCGHAKKVAATVALGGLMGTTMVGLVGLIGIMALNHALDGVIDGILFQRRWNSGR